MFRGFPHPHEYPETGLKRPKNLPLTNPTLTETGDRPLSIFRSDIDSNEIRTLSAMSENRSRCKYFLWILPAQKQITEQVQKVQTVQNEISGTDRGSDVSFPIFRCVDAPYQFHWSHRPDLRSPGGDAFQELSDDHISVKTGSIFPFCPIIEPGWCTSP